jgi:hypothetical protein
MSDTSAAGDGSSDNLDACGVNPTDRLELRVSTLLRFLWT